MLKGQRAGEQDKGRDGYRCGQKDPVGQRTRTEAVERAIKGWGRWERQKEGGDRSCNRLWSLDHRRAGQFIMSRGPEMERTIDFQTGGKKLRGLLQNVR